MRPSSLQLLRAAETSSFLITDPLHVRYLTKLALHGCCILASPRRFTLFVDPFSRPIVQARVAKNIAIADMEDLPKILAQVRKCGFESEHVTVDRRARWKKHFPHTKFIETEGVLQGFRRSKDEDEIRHLKRAKRITDELMRRVPSALRGRPSEVGLAQQLHLWAIELGAEGLAFDPIVAFGSHTSSPHHMPTSRTLKKGHLVQIDVGAKVNGYCGDCSEVFFTSKPTRLQDQIYAAVLDAQTKSIKAVRAGVGTHALDRIARSVFKSVGIEDAFSHSLGHGVGLEIHEGVVLSQKRPDKKLQKNEVITIEPGVYFPGKFGMRLEKVIFVA